PAVEPAAPQFEEIFGEVAVDRSRRAEIDIAGIAERAVAMRPRTEDQPDRTAFAARPTDVILDRRARIGVIPPGKIDDRHIGVTVAIALAIDPGPLPEFVKGPVRPLLEKIILVFRRSADRRMSFAPRHAREPRLDILGSERRFDRGIPGVGERVVVGPGRLL